MKLRPFGFAAAAAVTLAGLPALANGRFPAAGQIVVDPSNPTHLLVRTTYGLNVSNDGGAHWSWICESAIGYGGTEDPMVAITADGTIIAGIFEGLSVTYQGQYLPFLGGNFSQVLPYLVMLVVLLIRPYGLFGTPEIERV